MRRQRWLLLAALLLVAAGVLLSLVEREPAPVRAEVQFPAFRTPEYERQEKRRTLALPVPPVAVPGEPAPDPRRRDPFLVALPVRPDAPVVVFEANALRHSRLGERFVACLQAEHPEVLSEWVRETGIDPLKDIDRVAFAGKALVVSGFFDRARWDQLRSPEPYGQEGRIYRDPEQDGYVGAWRNQVLVLSENVEDARAAIDQLEGRVPVPESGIPEDMAYGEVYGVIPPAAFRTLLGPGQGAIADRLAAVASRVELHVDAMQDVAAEVRVKGEDAPGLSDLAKSLGAALAVARVKAQAEGDRRLADLLENASVAPRGGEFSLQLALPADRLETWFAGCGERRAGERTEGAGGADRAAP